MKPSLANVSEPVSTVAAAGGISTADLWLQTAQLDYVLCREFARRFQARLPRSLRSQRVGWELYGHPRYAILMPDVTPLAYLNDEEWYLYYPVGESLFRRTRMEREKLQMIILAESAEDWAELLRQAVHENVFEVRYEVAPYYINALGEVEDRASGYEFTLCADAPQRVSSSFKLTATGKTPEAAAQQACSHWLASLAPGTDSKKPDITP